jgi:hypothetical protein
MDVSDKIQLGIECGENANESDEMDEEDELSADQIQASKKVNSIATIEVLCLKPSSLSCTPASLCRMVLCLL